MEPLIRLRLLASRLSEPELQTAMEAVVSLYSANKILTIIFNHFVNRFEQNYEHQTDVNNLIDMISNIIDSREKKESHKTDTPRSPITIDSIPYEMIGECASYLQAPDYLHFSQCNRRIYIGCNSPSTLQTLYLSDYDMVDLVDLNQFPLLKTLGITPETLEDVMSQPKRKELRRLRRLIIDNDCSTAMGDIETLLENTDCIDIERITYLKCCNFGTVMLFCDFDHFCAFLSEFKHLNSFVLDDVYLTGYDQHNDVLSNRIWHSNELCMNFGSCVNGSVLFLRNRLLQLYAKQIVSLTYSESRQAIDVTCFPQLKELWVRDPNIESLDAIIKNASGLERIHFEISNSCRRAHGTTSFVFDEENTRNIITNLFTKHLQLKGATFHGNYAQIYKIMEFIRNALVENRIESITLVFTIELQNDIGDHQAMQGIDLCIERMLNALEGVQMKDVMFGVHFEGDNAHVFGEQMNRFKDKYLVYIFNDCNSIILSNKDCTINGYRGCWKKYEN
eukprot:174156_1